MNSKLIKVLTILLALLLLVFGLNKFFGYLPAPTLEGGAAEFMGALNKTGYMFPIIGIVESLAGLLLVLNKWKGFALVILAPISINIILFHLSLDLGNVGPGALIFVLNIFLLYAHKDTYKALF